MINDIWHYLSGVKVLDLTNELGFMCGKMLADIGADVIKIEHPTIGNAADFGADAVDNTDAEGNLFYFAYNAGKRSITLNLEKEEGQHIFRGLTEKADIIIESYPPGTMKQWRLDYDDLAQGNPRLIFTSITPFGRTGPYRDYKATDLTALAMSGLLFLTGQADRPPVRIGSPQAYIHAGSEACVGTMMALYQREMTGVGQLVDVSAQESILVTTFNTIPTWVTEQMIVPRMGTSRRVSSTLEMPLTWPCKNGYVSFSVFGGTSGGRTMRNLGQWMEEVGMGDDMVSSIDWGSFDFYGLTTAIIESVTKPIEHFFSNFTSEELFEGALKRGIMLFPVVSAEYILRDPHLEKKDFWQEIDYPGCSSNIVFPRSPIMMNGKYSNLESKLPSKGEHNFQVYHDLLGISRNELASLKSQGVV